MRRSWWTVVRGCYWEGSLEIFRTMIGYCQLWHRMSGIVDNFRKWREMGCEGQNPERVWRMWCCETLGKAFPRSRKTERSFVLFVLTWWIIASSSARAMIAGQSLRLLYWNWLSWLLDSKNHISRILWIFSKILLKVFKSEISRYEREVGFLLGTKRGMMITSFHPDRNALFHGDYKWPHGSGSNTLHQCLK